MLSTLPIIRLSRTITEELGRKKGQGLPDGLVASEVSRDIEECSAELEDGTAVEGSINRNTRGRSGWEGEFEFARLLYSDFGDCTKEQGALQEGHRPSEDGP